MKIAALTPVALGSEVLCADQCRKMFDAHITLPDLWSHWDDYRNRLALLALARDYEWVVWIDADERFDDKFSRGMIENHIMDMNKFWGGVAILYKVKEMWNERQWRADGIWGQKARIVVQKNPLVRGKEEVRWKTPNATFHDWPLQRGSVQMNFNSILHYGMSTPEKRKARLEKWRKLDPNNKHQAMGYEYMADETGIELMDL